MQEFDNTSRAFSNFRVLNGHSDTSERNQLFKHMAQLFSFVSDRCDDEQVQQYDQVLCQLADLVDEEARVQVAKLLAPLDRAPGGVVVRLASDTISVARPLLEFSKVLTDDDLIDIVSSESDEHCLAIAGRNPVTDRVSDAIADHGSDLAMHRLLQNENAHFGVRAIEKVVYLAQNDNDAAENLRGRSDINWQAVQTEISSAAIRVAQDLGLLNGDKRADQIGQAGAMVYNRLRNQAGFNANDWKVAWNQVKAVSDRNELDEAALARFARFGYGHHVASAVTMELGVPPEVFVKWLATQDYVAVTVALRSLSLEPLTAQLAFRVLPWRDMPTEADVENVLKRYQALGEDEAKGIFELWRTHAFRRRNEDNASVA